MDTTSPLSGNTGLHCAVEGDQPDTAALLLEAGADMAAVNK